MLKVLLMLFMAQSVPVPPNPMIIVGSLVATPDFGIFTATMMNQALVGNSVLGVAAGLTAVRQDAEARAVDAFSQFAKFPNTYAAILAGCTCQAGDSAFWPIASGAFVKLRTAFPNTYKAVMIAHKIKLTDDTF